MEKNIAEIIVKVLAVLSYIGAGITLIAGLAMILGGSVFGAFIEKAIGAALPPFMAGAFGVVMIVTGIVFLGFAVLDYFIGKGLWNHENWARIVTIIFSVLSILSFKIVNIIIGAVIIYLLAFEKTVVGLFSGAKPLAVLSGKPSKKTKPKK